MLDLTITQHRSIRGMTHTISLQTQTRPRALRALWTARCKSGYAYGGHTCNRSTARGLLLCSECMDAVAQPSQPSLWARILPSFEAMATPLYIMGLISVDTFDWAADLDCRIQPITEAELRNTARLARLAA